MQKPSDHISLIIEMGKKEVNIDIAIRSIKKNSDEKKEFTKALIDGIKRIDVLAIMSREALQSIVF